MSGAEDTEPLDLEAVEARLDALEKPSETTSAKDSTIPEETISASASVWYVSTPEGERGPLSLEVLSAQARELGLTPSTMAWREGAKDWRSISDITELLEVRLLLERASSMALPAPSSAAAPVRDLSALVEGEERDPTLGNKAAPTFQIPPAWRPKRQRRSVWLAPAAVALLCTSVGLGVTLILRKPVVVLVPVPVATPKEVGYDVRLAPAAAAPPTDRPTSSSRSPRTTPTKKAEQREGRAAPTADPEPEHAPAPKKSSGSGFDDLLAGGATKAPPKKESAAPKPTAEAKPALAPVAERKPLTQKDVVDGVTSQQHAVTPCVSAAKAKGEIRAGKHRLELDWTITTEGEVTNARLKGPAELLGTSLPACVASVVRRWKFPASSKEQPIRNFPVTVQVD